MKMLILCALLPLQIFAFEVGDCMFRHAHLKFLYYTVIDKMHTYTTLKNVGYRNDKGDKLHKYEDEYLENYSYDMVVRDGIFLTNSKNCK